MDRLAGLGFEIRCPTPGKVPTETDLLNAVGGCDAWLAGIEPVSKNVIAAADQLKVISRNGSGTDNLPLEYLKERGIEVCRAVGANAQGVAELALSLTFAGLRQIVWTHAGMRNGDWPRRLGREISGSRIGVIGLGAIGLCYAQACLALGAEVSGFDPFAPDDRLVHPSFNRVPLDTATQGMDAISLHAPMPQDGQPLLTAEVLAKVAPGTVLVNTARAGLVDQTALLAALDGGRVMCYATDVFDVEPPEMTPLLAHENTILTSHVGGFTKPSVARAASAAVDNILRVLAANGA